MELKVWFDGLPRIVCGVNEKTTCQDIVFALAQATGKTGRFTLIERWRNNERLLAPSEVLLKWSEHSADVQYILQCTAIDSKSGNKNPSQQQQQPGDVPPRGSNYVTDDIPAAPPPYRNPPSPVKSTLKSTGKELPPYRLPPQPNQPQHSNFIERAGSLENDTVMEESKSESSAQKSKVLIDVINQQRERLSAQQAELTKYDAEIKFWETKARLQERNIESITKEITRLEILSHHNDAQVFALRDMEEENTELSLEADRLNQEICTVRNDLVKCDEDLTHCRGTIRNLEDSAAAVELEYLLGAVSVAENETEAITALADSIEFDFKKAEADIDVKKAEMDTLVSLMKAANLESLEMGEEESLFRSKRRIRGSARQLKDAAPTTTNPHGVWV